MKKTLLSSILILLVGIVFAQPLPFDPNIRTGKLDNGLTYYIKHNEKPVQRANFYIAQKVGSILEEDNQRGLAHFLEHMAFNGTKNFPGKALLNTMERNGVKFGENVNAWTSIEQTVYMLTNVPTTNTALIDTCILILHDWSSFISLEGEEIDKERGVILEEMRQHQTSDMRILDKMLPEIYPNSPYGHRMPIGTKEVVAGFDHQALRDYYHKWYRPDLQGIIIIGDIDVDDTEKKIKEAFADIPFPEGVAERTRFDVADNDEPLVSICTDVEEQGYSISVMYKQDPTPIELRNDLNYWLMNHVVNIISKMYNNRIEEITMQPNPPFIAGYGYYGTFFVSDTKDAWSSMAISKDADGIKESIDALIAENKKMKEFGFTAAEYERAKADYLKHYETMFNERDKRDNGAYLNDILQHFLSNEPLIGIETEYQMLQQVLPAIPVEGINALTQELITDNNMVITLTAPQKDGEILPTKEQLVEMVKEAGNQTVEPYKEESIDKPLVAKLPKAGKIKKRENIEYGATMLTLSNGARVIYKPTTFKDDEILMSAYSYGGISAADDPDPFILLELNNLGTIGGLGEFSATDLPKVLAGKRANVRTQVSNFIDGMSGNCSTKDLETMLQLVYLNFTAPRHDDEAFQSYLTRTKAALANVEADPTTAFRDSLMNALYGNHPLAQRMKADDYDKINYKKALETYKQRYRDPNNFTFVFVGNIDPDTFEPLIARYIGGMKANKSNETWKDNGMKIANKNVNCHYEKDMETPKTTVYIVYNGKMENTLENNIYLDALTSVMDIVYTEKIREDEGGTYGVGVFGGINKLPEENYQIIIAFETNKEMHKKLINIAKDELNNTIVNGPREQDLQKVKEFTIKKHAEDLENNRYWLNTMTELYRDGLDSNKNFEDIVNGITVESMKTFAKQLLNGYVKEVVQTSK